jgi:hypothetical protein
MEANNSEAAQRLWADDENAKMRILNIDLSDYDGLVTFPAGVDWPRERGKLRFLQTALRLDIPWGTVVQFTAPYFGQTLFSPFVPVVVPIIPQPFIPPAFDIARQTVAQWAVAADEAWKAYRASVACGLQETRQELLQSGVLVEFDIERRPTGAAGQAKSPIMEEKTSYLWAVTYFFAAQCGKPPTWAEFAENELRIRKFKSSPTERAKAKRKLAEQVRTHVLRVLRTLKLPE